MKLNLYSLGETDQKSNGFLAKLLNTGKVAAKEQKYNNELTSKLASAFKKKVSDNRMVKLAEAIKRAAAKHEQRQEINEDFEELNIVKQLSIRDNNWEN